MLVYTSIVPNMQNWGFDKPIKVWEVSSPSCKLMAPTKKNLVVDLTWTLTLTWVLTWLHVEQIQVTFWPKARKAWFASGSTNTGSTMPWKSSLCFYCIWIIWGDYLYEKWESEWSTVGVGMEWLEFKANSRKHQWGQVQHMKRKHESAFNGWDSPSNSVQDGSHLSDAFSCFLFLYQTLSQHEFASFLRQCFWFTCLLKKKGNTQMSLVAIRGGNLDPNSRSPKPTHYNCARAPYSLMRWVLNEWVKWVSLYYSTK